MRFCLALLVSAALVGPVYADSSNGDHSDRGGDSFEQVASCIDASNAAFFHNFGIPIGGPICGGWQLPVQLPALPPMSLVPEPNTVFLFIVGILVVCRRLNQYR